MVCKMFSGTSTTCGNMTSGGTESILLAMKVLCFTHASRATLLLLLPTTSRRFLKRVFLLPPSFSQ
jgi:glutamate/tyrosine decarboxylase-like PLP-dependent enzyme